LRLSPNLSTAPRYARSALGRVVRLHRLVPALAAACCAAPAHDTHAQSSGVAVPLCEGLRIVTAINETNGDYESIKTIESVAGAAIRLKYTSEKLVTDLLDAQFGEVKSTTVYRSILPDDLAGAAFYQQRYFEGMPETIPGSTAIGVSSSVLERLKNGGEIEIAISNAYPAELGIDENVRPNIYDFRTTGTIARAEPSPVLLPVLVNDVPAELPAVHARGDFAGEAAEFFFLDDPANPLALKFRIGIDAIAPPPREMIEQCREMAKAAPEIAEAMCRDATGPSDTETLQVVSISYRCGGAPPPGAGSGGAAGGAGSGELAAGTGAGGLSAAAAALENELADNGIAAVYDIFFSFNSAEIRDESAPRLAEIAAVLARNPEWRLTVNGHTDSIASDAYNLELSARRAAAVQNALVARHGIDSERLVTAGFGETQPRDTNDTLEGRARNRRVELVKQ